MFLTIDLTWTFLTLNLDFLIQNISSKASYIQAAQQSQFPTRKQAILDSIEEVSIQEYIVEI